MDLALLFLIKKEIIKLCTLEMSVSEQELSEYREIFNLVDADKGGSISSDELSHLMTTLGIQTTPEELAEMIAEIDQDGNGDIDFDEFVQVMSRKVQGDYTAEDVRHSFKMFKVEYAPKGLISVKDLEYALTHYGKVKMSVDDSKELISQLDVVDGKFNYAEFVSMMMNQ